MCLRANVHETCWKRRRKARVENNNKNQLSASRRNDRRLTIPDCHEFSNTNTSKNYLIIIYRTAQNTGEPEFKIIYYYLIDLIKRFTRFANSFKKILKIRQYGRHERTRKIKTVEDSKHDL